MYYQMQSKVACYLKKLLVLCCTVGLTACATFSPDSGFNDVQKTTQRYIKQTPNWINSEAAKQANTDSVQKLLKGPLSAESAVQIALLNNAQLQADFYSLQLVEADLVQAGRLLNPSFSMFYARHNGDYKIEQTITMNIMALFTMGKATAIEKKHVEATKNNMVLQVLQLARKTRNAYIKALAAKQNVIYLQQVNESAHATYQLAKRMRKAGNWNAVEEGREQSYYQEAAINLSRAENDCMYAEEKLTVLLGLKHPAEFKMPPRLAELPQSKSDLRVISQDGFAKRLDLQQTRIHTDALAKQLGLSQTTRFIDVLEIGPARVLEGRRGDPYKKGVELRFELPIFNWGEAKVKRAEARYMQALYQASNQAIAAASEVRAQYGQYTNSYDIARRYRDEVIPLHQDMLKQSLLQYNGMLMSPFELMTVAREQVLAVNHYIQALRDFWLAESDLEMALVGTPSNNQGGAL